MVRSQKVCAPQRWCQKMALKRRCQNVTDPKKPYSKKLTQNPDRSCILFVCSYTNRKILKACYSRVQSLIITINIIESTENILMIKVPLKLCFKHHCLNLNTKEQLPKLANDCLRSTLDDTQVNW